MSEIYSVNTLKSLFVDSAFDPKTGQKHYQEAKDYLCKFFYPVDTGEYCFINNNRYKLLSHDVMRRMYLDRIPKELKKWYLTETKLYRLVMELNQPLIHEDMINILPEMLHKSDMTFEQCTKQQKDGVQMMLDFLKEVWANNNQKVYQYLIRWFANMVRGNKNQSLLYLKSVTEGIGKSTFTTFIKDHVIGTDLAIESTSEPLRSRFNSILSGKLLVIFEELEKTNNNDYETISKKLKTWVTSKYITYEQKGHDPYETKNISNYVINTNRDAIKGADGRRYCMLDLSTKRKGDVEYWNKLNETCFNDDVGKAFYLYLLSIDLTGFNSAIYPICRSKADQMADRLNPLYKMIKFNWLLQNKNLKCTVKELHDYYVKYSLKTNCKYELKKTHISGLMREINHPYKKSNGKSFYNISNEQLKDVANQFNWYTEFDSDELEENNIFEDNPSEEYISIKTKEYKSLLKQLESKPKLKPKPKQKKSKPANSNLILEFDQL